MTLMSHQEVKKNTLCNNLRCGIQCNALYGTLYLVHPLSALVEYFTFFNDSRVASGKFVKKKKKETHRDLHGQFSCFPVQIRIMYECPLFCSPS